MRRVGSRDHEHAGRAAIQTMHDSRTQSSARQCRQTMEQSVHQGSSRVARAGVNHHASGFVHDYEVIVLVENVKREILGLDCERRPLQNFDFNLFAYFNAMRRTRRAMSHSHSRFSNQFLYARAA